MGGIKGRVPAAKTPVPARGGDVEEDVDEGDDARDALQGVPPIALVGIADRVPFRPAEGVNQAENRVEGDGQPDAPDLHEEQPGQVPDEVDVGLVFLGTQ